MLRRISCCEHAVIHAPADGRTAYFTRALRPGSLPHVLAGSASAIDGFGTCSMFIHITACSLADSLYRSLLRQGLRTVHCFPARLDCYRLERKLPGGIRTLPLEFRAFSRRTNTDVIRPGHDQAVCSRQAPGINLKTAIGLPLNTLNTLKRVRYASKTPHPADEELSCDKLRPFSVL